jgi:hypothetical protein
MATPNTNTANPELMPPTCNLDLPHLTNDPNRLKIKLETLMSAMCGGIYDYLIYNVQENSASQQYKQQVRAFFKETSSNFIESLNNPPE